jgi:3-hydroxymyristoyl/3-hydroxydecanoyl-(acyl carrier protein) dehydratase
MQAAWSSGSCEATIVGRALSQPALTKLLLQPESARTVPASEADSNFYGRPNTGPLKPGHISSEFVFGEHCTKGHFSEMPLLPGWRMLAGIESLARATQPDLAQASGVRWRDVKFSSMVKPNSTLHFYLEPTPSEPHTVFTASAVVGENVACTAELTFENIAW